MVDLHLRIDEQLMERLRLRAEQRQQTIEEVAVESLHNINVVDVTLEDPDNFALTLGQLAEAAGLSSGRADVAERSRELLSITIPDEMKRRMGSS
jgi:hypothetical protein